MKLIIITLLTCLSISSSAQIKGSGNYTTKTFQLEEITSIDVSLYAQVTVDASPSNSSNTMTITVDDNLLKHIDMDIVDGRLYLNQKKWISPSDDIVITISAPQVEYIQQGTHETTIVTGIARSNFSAMANVGEIIIKGQVDQFTANAEVGKINATQLNAKTVDVNLWSWGTINLSAPEIITGKATNAGKVIYTGDNTMVKVNTKSDAVVMNANDVDNQDYSEHQYIDLKIKNNSSKRLHAYVRGPKPDGGMFSYGFPMRPNQIRKERWTVGTKVFRQSALGKKELVELTAEDEGTTVKLF